MRITLEAEVREGRLVLDEPIDLPDGTKVQLSPVDDDDGLDELERARLHESLSRSLRQFDQGEAVLAANALAQVKTPG